MVIIMMITIIFRVAIVIKNVSLRNVQYAQCTYYIICWAEVGGRGLSADCKMECIGGAHA